MSISGLESRERQCLQKIERLNKDMANAAKKEVDIMKKTGQLNQRLLRAKTSGQLSSINRSIANENKRLSEIKKKQSVTQKKVTETAAQLNKVRADLRKEREKESKKVLKQIEVDNQKRIEKIQSNYNGSNSTNSEKELVEHDIFFSYAHEDSDYADPLVQLMKEKEIDVIFDKNDLAWGQSIIDFIDSHLRTVKFGIILLTPTYLNKYWATYELKSLLQRHSRSNGQNIILPIWHNITADEVAQHSLALTDFNAMLTSISTQEEIANKVLDLTSPNGKQNDE